MDEDIPVNNPPPPRHQSEEDARDGGGGGDSDGSWQGAMFTQEQELALQQIIESNHMRQLRSTSPLPISGAQSLGASAPPNHSDDEYSSHAPGFHGYGSQNSSQAIHPCFPTGSALWRGMSGSPPNLASTWNSYHGYGPSNSAGASASSSLSRRGCATPHFATMSASTGLCGASISNAGLTANPSVNNVALFAATQDCVGNGSGRDSPASSSSSSFNAPVVVGATAAGGIGNGAASAAMMMHHHHGATTTSSTLPPTSSGINSLGLLDAAVVAELERTSLQSLVSCVDAAMAVGSGARTMDAAVVAELEKTSLHSLVSVMDASMHMHQSIGAHNSPKILNRGRPMENSPLMRPKLPTPSRALIHDSHGNSCSSPSLPRHHHQPHALQPITHAGGGGVGARIAAQNASYNSAAVNNNNNNGVVSETESTNSSESNIEMQVTRSGEQSRHFLASRSARENSSNSNAANNNCNNNAIVSNTLHGSSLRHHHPRGGGGDMEDFRRSEVHHASAYASVSTPTSPCRMSASSAAVDAATASSGVASSSHHRADDDVDDICRAVAEMSTSCPSTSGLEIVDNVAADHHPPSLHGSVKQKCRMLMKKKVKNSSTGGGGGESTTCLGGSGGHDTANEDGTACTSPTSANLDVRNGAAGVGGKTELKSPSATTTTKSSKNHGYAAPLQNADEKAASHQKVTSPALPQTPPPAIGSSSCHVQYQNNNGANTASLAATVSSSPKINSGVSGGAHAAVSATGAKSKLKHFTSFFSRGRRRGKSGSSSVPGFDGGADVSTISSSCEHSLVAAASTDDQHHLHHRPLSSSSHHQMMDSDNGVVVGRSDCGACQSCVLEAPSFPSDNSSSPMTTTAAAVKQQQQHQQKQQQRSASSKLISTVVGHLTGSPVRRPSAHAAAAPGRHHPHFLDSCWGRAGSIQASASRDQISGVGGGDNGFALESSVDAAIGASLAAAHRPRHPLPTTTSNMAAFPEASLVPFAANFSVALLSANPMHAMARPHLFHHLHHVGGVVVGNASSSALNPSGVVVDDDAVSHGFPAISSAAVSSSATVESQKSEYGGLGPDGRLIPRTVHTQVDYMHHLVNDLKEISACSFYWGVMDRYEAERLLDNKPEGTFLLRDSAQEDFLFSVSFRRYGRSLHARIEQWQHKFSFDALDPGVFSSDTVCGLIAHYKDPTCCMFFEPMLTIPLNRSFVFSLQHLCRATICKNLSYDGINLLQLPNVSKDYLKYYHYKQKIRERRYETNVSQ